MSTKEEALEKARQDVTVIKRLFTGPDGQRAYDFMAREFSDRSSFVACDPHATAFREGQRSVILFIKDSLESDYEN